TSTVKLCVLAALVTHKVTCCSPAADWPANAPGMQPDAGLSPLAGMLQAVSDKAMAKALQRLNWLKVMNNILFYPCTTDGGAYGLFGETASAYANRASPHSTQPSHFGVRFI
ncbi:MAG: hypothetical protein RLZZ191_685, partial [Pseudomonadota bacterium]